MALDHVSTWWAGWQVGMGGEQGMLLPSGSGLLSRLVKTRKARPGKQQTVILIRRHCTAGRLVALHWKGVGLF